MYKLIIHLAVTAIIVAITFASQPTQAQETSFPNAEAAMATATDMLGGGDVGAADNATLRKIRSILDTIVQDFPASDIAVKILFQDKINGLDIAALDQRLQAAPESNSDADTTIRTDAARTETAMESETTVTGEDTENTKGSTAPPEAQESAQVVEAASQEVPFSPLKFEYSIRDLAKKVHNCYVRGPLEGGTKRQAISFSIARSGRLDGLPKAENTDGLTGSVLRTFMNVTIALDSCGPYPSRFSNRSYEAEFDGSGLTKLIDSSAVEAPWSTADKKSFTALKMDRKAIAEVQARLEASAFDPKGVDGVWGKGTRNAVAAWQRSQSIPATGYMDARQLEKLKQVTEPQFAIWQRDGKNKAKLERASRPRSTSTTSVRPGQWYRNSSGLYCKHTIIGTWCQSARP